MTILEALNIVTSRIKSWAKATFLTRDETTAEDFGVYIKDNEPTSAIDGNIWVDTSSEPVIKVKQNGVWADVVGAASVSTSITVRAEAWTGTASPYSQVVSVDDANANSRVDLCLSPEQLNAMEDMRVTFVAVNEDGIVTIYAIGNKPTSDYTINAMITDVIV